MNKKFNIFFILSFIFTIVKLSYAESLNGEQFYIITVKDSEPKNHNKRQEISTSVESTIEEIHNLIVENIDTYDNQEKLEELDGESILYAYLTEEIAAIVKKFPNVKSISKDIMYEPASASYDLNKIKKDTKWNGVEVRENAPSQLSLISQGKYDPSFINEYDDNYYFPQSGGKGINIFIFDTGFDFRHEEFSNKERTVKCIFNVTDAKLIQTNNESVCYGQNRSDHGTACATVAGGKTLGSASEANIYGVLLNKYSYGNTIAAMDYILNNEKLMKPHQSIFSLSFSSTNVSYDNHPEKYHEKNDELDYFNTITKAGGIIFTSAGNDGVDVNDVEKDQAVYPCVFDNIICVGGTDNYQSRRGDYSFFKNNVGIPYAREVGSNFGEEVDLYAPIYSTLSFIDYKGMEKTNIIKYGTSLSAPLVAGVAATIMSDKRSTTEFTKDTMLQYLKDIAQKNIVDRVATPNYFVNNGKKEVYSKDNTYNGCGKKYNNRKCPNNLCCSAEGRCGDDYEYCSKGCQVKFGYCF
ncbi:carbohydrate-binding module family 18 protein [Piromyces sp. E2]|nr:carbohydrate-binding module family 18 protein [Piromyces sp. E2]|eukprot:OUM66418.1 carbohydrate-binding module family 18 protein [Piromyces sp. E2]